MSYYRDYDRDYDDYYRDASVPEYKRSSYRDYDRDYDDYYIPEYKRPSSRSRSHSSTGPRRYGQYEDWDYSDSFNSRRQWPPTDYDDYRNENRSYTFRDYSDDYSKHSSTNSRDYSRGYRTEGRKEDWDYKYGSKYGRSWEDSRIDEYKKEAARRGRADGLKAGQSAAQGGRYGDYQYSTMTSSHRPPSQRPPSHNYSQHSSTSSSQLHHQRPPSHLADVPTRLGPRRALLIGINYRGQGRKELFGSINDVRCLAKFLEGQGWQKRDIVIMDEDQPRDLQPTYRNILRELKSLSQGVRSGDSLFLSFSGHGIQMKDLSGDEADGLDEVIVSVDNRPISDDVLFDLVVKHIPRGALLTAITDCCHSGTILDLPFTLRPGARLQQGRTRQTNGGDVICFSGCQDNQTSGDIDEGAGRAGGACTNALLAALAQRPNISYQELLISMDRNIKSRRLKQMPMISATYQLESNRNFSLTAQRDPVRPIPPSRAKADLNPFISYIELDRYAVSHSTGPAVRTRAMDWNSFGNAALSEFSKYSSGNQSQGGNSWESIGNAALQGIASQYNSSSSSGRPSGGNSGKYNSSSWESIGNAAVQGFASQLSGGGGRTNYGSSGSQGFDLGDWRSLSYEERAVKAIPATVRMFSGCRDEQTSADVSNTASFGLPENSGPGGAGGACTNAMLLALSKNPRPTWIQLLEEMRTIIKQKGFQQVPELSSSRQENLKDPFDLVPKTGGNKKALLIGINYVGQKSELRGCVNDVKKMKQYLQSQGFSDFKILADADGIGDRPTRDNIFAGFQWLAAGAKPGDSLFFHYSGHGSQTGDTSGDETEGKDETIVPVDYQSAGQIIDDDILSRLVLPLPEGCQLSVVMDCCHSGSVLDLPYVFQANDSSMGSIFPQGPSGQMNQHQVPPMNQNPFFHYEKFARLLSSLFSNLQSGNYGAVMGNITEMNTIGQSQGWW